MPVLTLTSNEKLDSLIKSSCVCVVHFSAPWAPQCQTMNDVLKELEKQFQFKGVQFIVCDAEDLCDISLKFNITAVPTILIFKGGNLVETVNGAHASILSSKLSKVVSGSSTSADGAKATLEDRLKGLINKSHVVVFMKGSPQQPRCGFSKTLMEILNETKIPFETFDILQDEEVRQGLKTYSNWPTYPQIYVKGELVGGLDIIKELKQSGELIDTLQGK